MGGLAEISQEGLRVLPREHGVWFCVVTFEQSDALGLRARQHQVLELYAIAAGTSAPAPDGPTARPSGVCHVMTTWFSPTVICMKPQRLR